MEKVTDASSASSNSREVDHPEEGQLVVTLAARPNSMRNRPSTPCAGLPLVVRHQQQDVTVARLERTVDSLRSLCRTRTSTPASAAQPSSSTTIHTRPCAPSSLALAPSARRPGNAARALGPDVDPSRPFLRFERTLPKHAELCAGEVLAERSAISMPNRRSGLSGRSDPSPRDQVSAGERERGRSAADRLDDYRHQHRFDGSVDLGLRPQKDPSRSSWVNSTCRSARKSSSR